MPRRWIRLDATWEDSEWLDALDGTAAGCWPRLLCMVKRDGIKGACKRPSLSVLARRWRVPMEAIQALEAAAIGDGAMTIEDGEWVVTGWVEYQDDPTAKDRVKKYRAEKSRLSPLRSKPVTPPLVTHLLSRVTETELLTDRQTDDVTRATIHAVVLPSIPVPVLDPALEERRQLEKRRLAEIAASENGQVGQSGEKVV